MRKYLLMMLMALMLPLTNADAQTYRYQASQFAYRIKNAYGNWSSWSDWQSSDVVIDINLDTDFIIVYSNSKQIYYVDEYLGLKTDSGGGKQIQYRVIDQDKDWGTIRLRIEANGNSQLYVDFNDVSWVYSGLKKIN